MFVYQEWDMLREKFREPEERLKKSVATTHRKVSFGVRMQEARLKQRCTITDLARELDIPSRVISLYENGSEVPSPIICERIIKYLSMEDLWFTIFFFQLFWTTDASLLSVRDRLAQKLKKFACGNSLPQSNHIVLS